jgi:DNA-binding NarL/FixJ family response regulator
MPVTSGPQVLEMIRSETKTDTIPVIFLTGKGDRESVLKVLALKPDGYLLKSMEKAALLKSLEEFFEKKKHEQLHEVQK